ncbi:virulence factor TspB C-terminal domain-related protein [Vibrio parahaemolyticus]|uniref:virulence factor TspB C-terminal domain-related protein n=1 Tax=Vibrio parahaemolyticus TaxID=670 RepID=UPI000D52FB45|nr:virulence factor TspB C-terminal domain-related protein [Vibrio parahaemolyticus]
MFKLISRSFIFVLALASFQSFAAQGQDPILFPNSCKGYGNGVIYAPLSSNDVTPCMPYAPKVPNFAKCGGAEIRSDRNNSYLYCSNGGTWKLIERGGAMIACADGTTQGEDGLCYPDAPEPPPEPSCGSPEIQKQVQIEKYKCDVTTPETEFFAQVFQWWCEDGDVYTYCGHEPKDCIQGLTCSSPDKDKPICDPSEQECPLPEPDPETPGQPDNPNPPPTQPDDPNLPDVDICETFPELCTEPENPEPPTPPVPDPDVPSDPDAPTDDKLLNEAIESNNHLTNIGEFIKSNTSKLGDLLVQNNMIGQHQLGKLNDILNKTFGGGAGGIGTTISQGNEIAEEGNKKLDELGETLEEIACELDDSCEQKEKPTANVDCEQSIFECKGDVIQCALLKIEYENSCATGELAQLEAEMNAAFGVDNVSALVDPEELDFSDIDSKYLANGVSFGNAGCPTPETHTFTHFAGSSTIEISYEPACHYAQVAAPIHVILAWISGLLLIGRTQGAF